MLLQPMLREAIVAQFARPHGPLGRLAGAIMAQRGSNRARNLWTVERLALEPAHAVLEIGCGPGVALAACAARLPAGRVVGLDHSPLMLASAARRLAALTAAGLVVLEGGGLERLADWPGRFDRVFSVNVVSFLDDWALAFAAMRACLKPGGRCAVTCQPRLPGASRATALAIASRVAAALRDAGFVALERHELPLRPAPAICVIGQNG